MIPRTESNTYHGCYGQQVYHPLLNFDGTTYHLNTAVLRRGTVHASHGVLRIVAAIRDR